MRPDENEPDAVTGGSPRPTTWPCGSESVCVELITGRPWSAATAVVVVDRKPDEHDAEPRAGTKHDRLVIAVVSVWLMASIAIGVLLYVRHAAIDVPERTDMRLRAAANEVLSRQGGDGWKDLHVMYRSCPCSGRTIEHLLARGVKLDMTEVVVMVDDQGAPGAVDERLWAAGYRVEVITPRELREKFGIEAAPVFVVVAPEGHLAYVGGYNRHKSEPRFADLSILDDVIRQHKEPAALPVYGCATSARLARAIDPLGMSRRKGAQRD